jgi:uncharacterized protein
MKSQTQTPTEVALVQAQTLAFSWVAGDATGHDEFHIQRVRQMARHLGSVNRADLVVVDWAALFHDALDAKLVEDSEPRLQAIGDLMQTAGLSDAQQALVFRIMKGQGFAESLPREKGEFKVEVTASQANSLSQPTLPIEFQVVRDADRLDAMGAIGIARCFAYGGRKGQVLHDPALSPRQDMTQEKYRKGRQSSLNHFFEKLLLLKDLMHTPKAKALAQERHMRLLNFLNDFQGEWKQAEID